MIVLTDIGEEGLQPVIVLLQNGIELVIVTAGAAKRHAEEYRPHRIGDVAQDLLPAQLDDRLVGFLREVTIEADGDPGVLVRGVKLITRDLLANEAVIRIILIESLNDVI